MGIISSGAASLPSQWAVDAGGNLTITPTADPAAGKGTITLEMPAGQSHDHITARNQGNRIARVLVTGGFDSTKASLGGYGAAFAGVVPLAAEEQTNGNVVFQVNDAAGVDYFDASGNLVARVLAAGALVTAQNSAPADGTLSAGQASIWFDKTNGAAKLMVKAKQNDGTVKTATIALA